MSGAPTDFVYNSARAKFAEAAIKWSTSAVNAMLVNGFYSPQLTHNSVANIPSNAIVVRDLPLTSLTDVNGICAGKIPQIVGLVSPAPVVALILYVLAGTDATSQLLYYTSTGPGFPFDVNGFSYTVAYDQANGGYFQV